MEAITGNAALNDPASEHSIFGKLPTPDEIAFQAAIIRGEWTMQQRWRRRKDLMKASVVDQKDGFLWPATDLNCPICGFNCEVGEMVCLQCQGMGSLQN
jgi:hypothetical protein